MIIMMIRLKKKKNADIPDLEEAAAKRTEDFYEQNKIIMMI